MALSAYVAVRGVLKVLKPRALATALLMSALVDSALDVAAAGILWMPSRWRGRVAARRLNTPMQQRGGQLIQ